MHLSTNFTPAFKGTHVKDGVTKQTKPEQDEKFLHLDIYRNLTGLDSFKATMNNPNLLQKDDKTYTVKLPVGQFQSVSYNETSGEITAKVSDSENYTFKKTDFPKGHTGIYFFHQAARVIKEHFAQK